MDPVAICNLGLSFFGDVTIMSLNDESQAAQYCKTNYDPSRRAVLAEREWTFAVKRILLNMTTETAPLNASLRYYTIPDKCIRLINVFDVNETDVNYRREGNRIVTDHYNEEIAATYTYDETNNNLFSALFDQLLAAHIAKNIAVPLTGDIDTMVAMAQLYQDNLDRATASDALQGSREMLAKSRMEETRRHHIPIV